MATFFAKKSWLGWDLNPSRPGVLTAPLPIELTRLVPKVLFSILLVYTGVPYDK